MLETISFSQRQRLAYIDFCLLFKGAIHRQDLINRFEVGLSAGSRDFTLYKELAPDNLIYDPREALLSNRKLSSSFRARCQTYLGKACQRHIRRV